MLSRFRSFGVSGIAENEFRQFYLQTDIKQARLATLLLAFPMIGLIINDYGFYGLSANFLVFFLLRIFILLFISSAFIFLKQIKNYGLYDRIVTVGAFALLFGSGVIHLSRPQNFIAHAAMACVAIFIVYLVIPNRFRNQIFLGIFTTLGELGIVAYILHPSDIVTFTTILFSLVAANIIAMRSSWQLHSYRRRNYKDLLHRKSLQEDLEKHSKNLEGIVAERTERLKDAERLAAIGATAGMVGHDIRNPLTAITGAIYVSKKRIKEMPNGVTKDSLTKSIDLIEDQTLYINKIVADLQDFARPLNPFMERTDIDHLIKSVISTLDVPDNILVEHKINENCPPLLTDQTFLRRILNNLSNNAIQAMPDGGKLTVGASTSEDKIVITVQDTGVGIPEEARSKIFTPMFTTKSKGQGFGLAVIKRMTEALGGTVSFESEQGIGTKFTVILPVRH